MSRRPLRPPVGPRLLRSRLAVVGPALGRRPFLVAAATAVVALLTIAGFSGLGEPGPTEGHVMAARATTGFGRQETARILSHEHGAGAHLAKASATPGAAPASVSDSPPMVPGEVFAFVPYWTLATQIDLSGVNTVAYFGLSVNADGSLQESGTGWDGYRSQALVDLVRQAHAAGARAVLTLSCFAQAALDQLTSSPAAATRLARQAVAAMRAMNFDGVNLDLEGQGPTDAAGLTRLVADVSRAVHAVNPDDQVTMDTYASSASGAGSFFDIPALSKVVNGFFVMAYDLNLASAGTPASPMTSTQFSDAVAAAQYAAAVPPSMVIFGASFYGYEWPTTNGTLVTRPTGTPTPVTFGQELASGHPIYWDPVTDTSWTSYEVGSQWFEAYFEDPAGLAMVAQLAHRYGFGTGVWALGMQGGDGAMLAAIEGRTAGGPVPPAGPAATSSSGAPSPPAASTTTTTTTTAPRAARTVDPTTSTTGPSSTTTPDASYRYSGVWDGQTVALHRVALSTQPATTGTAPAGTLSGFETTDPSVACLQATPHPMDVYPGAGGLVAEARTPEQCVSADFLVPDTSAPTTTTTTTTATAG